MAVIAAVAGAVWLFGPVVFLAVVFGVCRWRDEQKWRKDQRRLALFIALEESWMLPSPHDRRHG